MKVISIADLLAERMDRETNAEIRKTIKALINKVNSCSTTPLNTKHAEQMLPFSNDIMVYNTVLDIIGKYKIWELYSYRRDPKGFRMYDIKTYWYMIALLLYNLSDNAEEVISEIIDNITHRYDSSIMSRTLGFFNDDKTNKLNERLQNRLEEIILV